METVCQNRNIEIVMDLSEESPVVNLDNSLFEQVLVNIIKNAAESIDRDGKIYIRTTVRPTCLEIADTGQGHRQGNGNETVQPVLLYETERTRYRLDLYP